MKSKIILRFIIICLLFSGCSITTQIKPQIEYDEKIILKKNSYIYRGEEYYFNKKGRGILKELTLNIPEAQFELKEYDNLMKTKLYEYVMVSSVFGYGIFSLEKRGDYPESSLKYERYNTNSNICLGILISWAMLDFYRGSKAEYHLRKAIILYNKTLDEK